VAEVTDVVKRGAAVVARSAKNDYLWAYDPGWVSEDGLAAPALATVNGAKLVFTAHWARQKGTGTTADRQMLRVVALASATGRPKWTKDIDVPAGLPEAYHDVGEWLPRVNLHPAVSDGRHIAVAFDYSGHGIDTGDFTIVLDAAQGEQRWQKGFFQPAGFAGDALLGIRREPGLKEPLAMALATADGDTQWDLRSDSLPDPIGDGLGVVIESRDLGAPGPASRTHVMSAETGKALVVLDNGYKCHFDRQETIVCGWLPLYKRDPHVVAIDRKSGKQLWELPDDAAKRLAPRIIGACRGAVYGAVTKDEIGDDETSYVILDARTGKDKVAEADVRSLPTRCPP
jgi:outer membrane protein assembly factor BamB